MKRINWCLIGALACWAEWENVALKSVGESIQITWTWPVERESSIKEFSIYRTTGVSSTPAKLAVVSKNLRIFQYVMPGGVTKQYRFRVYAVDLAGSISPAGNEVLVNRK